MVSFGPAAAGGWSIAASSRIKAKRDDNTFYPLKNINRAAPAPIIRNYNNNQFSLATQRKGRKVQNHIRIVFT